MMTLTGMAGFAAACAIGGSARYLVSRLMAGGRTGAFPLPTLVVNLSGAFLAGFFYAAVEGDTARMLLLIGFCGCYTTMSTFGVETARLARLGKLHLAAANTGISLFGALLAAALGMHLAGLWS